MTDRILPMGDRAVLVELLHRDPARWARQLRRRATDLPSSAQPVDIVPAAATVLVTVPSPDALADLRPLIRALVAAGDDASEPTEPTESTEPTLVEIAVRYDGIDLDDVASATGLTVDDVIRRHSGATYEAAFCGFAAGFAYLRGLDPALHLPRRSTPRTVVPSGTVAIAAGYTAVYPRNSPGGWHLLGTTSTAMFDAAREPPALVAPGDRVRFVPT